MTAVASRAPLRPRVRIDAAVIGPGLALAAMIIVYSVLSPHFSPFHSRTCSFSARRS